MGIPQFYRGLTSKYPGLPKEAVEKKSNLVDGVPVFPDSTLPNPNGFEYDNLYLDMNGIIHPCFHNEHIPSPDTYDEIFKCIFEYIDRIFSIVRPRKVLYLAIDGVAPRAKMNQQRSRRFRTAKDAKDKANKARAKAREAKVELVKSVVLDSNIITPGTEFMALLSTALSYYVHKKMNEDPGWRGVKVIISDANVPGEGEHKIMSYIRLQKKLPGYDPNTCHCLYGLDADLILLALATHEINFSILREKKKKKGVKYSDLHDLILRQPFQFLHMWLLRSYLEPELTVQNSVLELDFERHIDDFVFMCLFLGNDFLPRLPTIDIQQGAIHQLTYIYRMEFANMGGYLTDSHEVNLKRVQHFINALGYKEELIFKHSYHKKKEKGTTVASDSETVTEQRKRIYYAQKFDAETKEDQEWTKKDAALKYVEGLCWVMRYYYQGVCSWEWFYPYHYAPFASDICGIDELEIKFTLGKPLKPFEQLMAVLPAASAQALPKVYRKLMRDPSSPIIDCYPTDFRIDMNGKRRIWQGVCRLPFVEMSRLLSEIAKVEPKLTKEQKERNSVGLDKLCVHLSHPIASQIVWFCGRNTNLRKLEKIDCKLSDGMNGYIRMSNKPMMPVEIPSPINDMPTIRPNKVICTFYKLPYFSTSLRRPIPENSLMGCELGESAAELLLQYYHPCAQLSVLGKRKAEDEKFNRDSFFKQLLTAANQVVSTANY